MVVGVNFKYVKKNLSLLLNLHRGDILTTKSNGQLVKVENKLRKKAQLFNALSLNRQHIKTVKTIIFTFSIFLHEMKNPIDLAFLKLTYEKTMDFTQRALFQIKMHPKYQEAVNVIEQLIKDYEKNTLTQIDIISNLIKFVSKSTKKIDNTYQDAIEGILSRPPKKTKAGASGAYLMHGKQRFITGVFKPFDEEIGAPNNPTKRNYRGPLGSKLLGYHTNVGSAIFKEVAAYKVSEYLKLDVVPPTTFASFKSDKFYKAAEGVHLREQKEKMGSLQKFCAGYKHIYELSQNELESLPIDQLHRIFILDIILGNMDRNFSNLLTDGKKIIAIDHGLSLPDRLSPISIDSLKDLPQFNMALFGLLKEKVLSINPEKLKQLLKKECCIEEKALIFMVKRVKFLQEAVNCNQQLTFILNLFKTLCNPDAKQKLYVRQ